MQQELKELPGVAIDPTPLVNELLSSFWTKILAMAGGWLIAHTSVSPETINAWQGDTLKIVIALSSFVLASFLSYLKLKKNANSRFQLAMKIEQKNVRLRAKDET